MRLIRSSIVFGTGYVLGARAGKERYEQIAAAAQKAAADPRVQPYLGPLAGVLGTSTSTSSSTSTSTGPGAGSLPGAQAPVLGDTPGAAPAGTLADSLADLDPPVQTGAPEPVALDASAPGLEDPVPAPKLTGRQRRRRSQSST